MAGTGQHPDPRQRIHRLRANHREWTPAQIIYLRAAARVQQTADGEEHTLAGWTARLDVRRSRCAGHTGTVDSWGRTAGQLAAQIDAWTAGQRCVWLYAHGLAYEMALTRLPAELAERGWQVTGHAVTSDSPWLRMRRAGCVITIADASGWLRATMAALAATPGVAAADAADPADGLPPDLAGCLTHMQILASAMGQMLNWWDGAHLGNWTLTGSGGGWNSYRHRSPGPLPLIIPGDDAGAADRDAIYGGRRESFAWGELAGGPWVLADFRAAYPTIAATLPLPVARQGNFASLPVDSPLVCGSGFGIIARVLIDTHVPRWPVRVNGRIAYPVGQFWTVMCGPEIAEARRLGCLRQIGPGRLHKLSYHMAEWARWVLDVQAGADESVPPVARRAVKHWGRATIGKFAAHGFQTRPLTTLGGKGWYAAAGWNAQLQAPCTLTEVCGAAAETIQWGDSDSAYPAVFAWVESWGRVYLARAMEAAGLDQVVCCDTDGFIVAAAADWQSKVAFAQLGAMRLAEKARYDRVRVIGPQHVITDTDRKLSGIPRSAKDAGGGKMTALTWPGLAWQMEHGSASEAARYVRPRVTYSLPETLVTGWRWTDGRVTPLVAAVCRYGGTHLLPHPLTGISPGLETVQSSHLAFMIEPLPGKGRRCTHHSSKSNGTDSGSGPSHPTTSSPSSRRTARRKAGRHGIWRTFGTACAAVISRVSSGWTRISSLTRSTWSTCTAIYRTARMRCTSRLTGSGRHRQAGITGSGDMGSGAGTVRK